MPDTAKPIKVVLGFDFGLKRIGVAVGQTVTATASPLCTLKANNGAPRWEEIIALIDAWQPQAFVVGRPVHADGTAYESTHAATRFGNRLNGRYGLPVFWVDERLSSHAAKHWLSETPASDDKLDSLSAKIILETWLSERK